ncbi:MAG TPA: hypothetical protein DEP84_23950 [Chloroflexi bacterium]|nr:hypothetical protein [Chloroflexota bacterium]
MIIGNPMIFRHYPLEEALHFMVRFGYQGVELWPPQIEAFQTGELRQQLSEHISSLGLSLVRLNSAGADYFVPLGSEQDAEQILNGLKQDVDLASSLGMRQLLTWEGRIPKDATPNEIHGWILDETVDIFRDAIRYAEDKGISISVEVHPFTLGIDLDFLCKLYDRVDSESFGVTYDCCHFGVGLPESYAGAIIKMGHRIKHVHFSDSDKRTPELHFPPGKGCLDLDAIVAALKQIDFKGTLMLDLWLYPLPEEGTKIGAPYLRQVGRVLGIDSPEG